VTGVSAGQCIDLYEVKCQISITSAQHCLSVVPDAVQIILLLITTLISCWY